MTTSGPPTLDDVAQSAGVSRSTASRAINGGLRVSPEAQAAVDDAVARLGYAPNRAARSLVTRRTDSIALVVPEPDQRILTDPFLSGTLAGVSEGLAGTDLQLVLLLARPGEQRGRVGRYLRSGHVDGVIVASHHQGDQLETELGPTMLPAVFVGRLFEPDPQFSRGLRYVDVDNVTGGRIATQRMIDRGRRRIGTITGPLDMPAGVDRMIGWRDALRDAGLPDDAVVEGDFTSAGAVVAARRLLDQHPDLDGIFAASDLMAEATLRVLADRGRSVPGDVSVVGFDDLGIAETTSPRLTTVHNPVVQMVGAATSMLVDLVAGRPVRDERRIFAPRLIEGDSA